MRPPHRLVVVGAKRVWPSQKQVNIIVICKRFPPFPFVVLALSLSLSRSRSLGLGRCSRGGDGLRRVLDEHVCAIGSALEHEVRANGSALHQQQLPDPPESLQCLPLLPLQIAFRGEACCQQDLSPAWASPWAGVCHFRDEEQWAGVQP